MRTVSDGSHPSETATVILIFAASTRSIDLNALNELVAKFDHATDEGEREHIAEEVERMVGEKAKAALKQKFGTFNLSSEEINSLATEAIDLALRGVGRVHLRRSDIVPEELVRQMSATESGRRLLELLSQPLQQALRAPYLKQDVENWLLRELNALLDRDLAQDLGITGPTAPRSAIQRTIDNAQMLASAFPGALGEIKTPPLHFMGYLTKNVIPTLGQRVKKEKGSIPQEVARTWRAIRPVVEDLRASSGGAMPSGSEVREEWLRRIRDRYGPALAWWNKQMREIGRPFRIDHRSFSDAKDILRDQGYDPSLWEGQDAEYRLPKDFLKPFSIDAIERAMAYQQGPASRTLPAQPVAPSVPDEGGADAPSWARQVGQQQGRGRELYRAIVQSLYPDTESAERQIGELLAENASDETIESYIRKVELQDPDLADYLRSSWHAIARQIDSRVTEALSDPSIVGPIARQFGFSPAEVGGQREAIRRAVFIRNAGRIDFLFREGFITRSLAVERA